MKYSGILSHDAQNNFPSAAYDALKDRKMKERSEVITHADKFHANPKRKMNPPKKSLKPRKVL